MLGTHIGRRGILHLHLVQCRNLHRSSDVGATSPAAGFALSIDVGLFHSCAAAAASSASEACAVEPALLTGMDGSAVWNAEVELPFRNADAWLFVRAHQVPTDDALADRVDNANTQTVLSRRRSRVVSPVAEFGESRVPIKEYDSGVYHDVWLTLRRPNTSRGPPNAQFVEGQVHIRFMFQLEEQRQLAGLARIQPPLSVLLGSLLHNDALWVQVLLAHLDWNGGQDASTVSTAQSTALVQAILSVLSHARFGLLLHVLERLIEREVDELARQHSSAATGALTSAWASNLFRRNSLAPRLMSAFCLQQAQTSIPGNINSAQEGAGKQYLLLLLTPFVQHIIADVCTTTAISNDGSAASQNPYEIDPARLGYDHALVTRNQITLMRACQALLNLIVSSLPSMVTSDSEDDCSSSALDASAFWPNSIAPIVPEVPVALRVVARTLKRTVEQYAARAPKHTPEHHQPDIASPQSPKSPALDAVSLSILTHESTSNSLASFFFLRFLCPALVTPVHYGLLARPPSAAATRALILVAKTLQSLVNAAGSASSMSVAALDTTAITNANLSISPSAGISAGTSPASETVTPLSTSMPTDSISAGTSTSVAPSSSRSTISAPTHRSVPSAASSRLFKESYMEACYPFVNQNLSRISCFLDTLASDPVGDGVLPGVEEALDSTASAIEAGDEVSSHRELERALWILLPFLHAHMAGLEETAWRMHTDGSIDVPAVFVPPLSDSHAVKRKSNGGNNGASPGKTNSPLASQMESGLSALRELTRPRHYNQSSTKTSRATGAQVHAFISRFRQIVSSIPIPTSMMEAANGSFSAGLKRGNADSESNTNGYTNNYGNGAGLSNAAPAAASALAQAASNSLKFLSRFLPGAEKQDNSNIVTVQRDRGPSSSASSVSSHQSDHSSADISGKPRRLSNMQVTSPLGVSSHSLSSSSCNFDAESFQLFKQTSVEIQLRLTAQLEDADKRAHSLLVSYQQEEAITRRQQDQLDTLHAHIALLQQEINDLRAVAGSAADSVPVTAPFRASSPDDPNLSVSASVSASSAVAAASAEPLTLPRVVPIWRIRRARPEDVSNIDGMIRELAEFERAPDAVVGTPQMLHDCLFRSNARLHAHVIEVQESVPLVESTSTDGLVSMNADAASSWRVVGMAIWFETYSTWLGRHGIWLEDLYIQPAYRGVGLGTALLRQMAIECVQRHYQRLDFYVLNWNTAAHKTYQSIGASALDDWELWRLCGSELISFASKPALTIAADSSRAPPPVRRIRRATPDDVIHMDAMIRELAVYEKAPDSVVGTSEMLRECLFPSNGGASTAKLHAHIAEIQVFGASGIPQWKVTGMAIWFETYSTWLGRHGIWLEDLYVRPVSRGMGLGGALLRTLAAEAVARKYQRLDWYCLRWNEPARKVYFNMGAKPLTDWSMWRLEGKNLNQFAQTITSDAPPT
jgi:GNAT superfamily N-acetyltransferase